MGQEQKKKSDGQILTCTSPTQRDGPIDHPMGSLVHLFEILREEDQAAVKVAIADVSATFPSKYNNSRDQAQAQD
jgi:hypothetical protein